MPDHDDCPEGENAADLIDEHIKIRTLPRPPAFLLKDLLDGFAVRAPSRSNARVVELVAPHWNQAVRQLGPDGAGYLALQRVRDELRLRSQAVSERTDFLDSGAIVLERVLEVFAAQAVEHGPDELVGTSLGLSAPAPPGGWRWENDGGQVYILETTQPDAVWEQGARSVRTFRKAYSHESWRAAYERAESAKVTTEEKIRPLARRWSAFTFREEVIGQVLMEFEVLGYVGLLGTEEAIARALAAPDLSQYKPDELLFIVAAAEALAADPENQIMRNGILGNVDDTLTVLKRTRRGGLGEIKWYEGKAKRVAERPRIGAYETQSGEGTRPAGSTDQDLRADFANQVRELAAQVGEAGVKTIDDVLDRAE